MKKKLHQIEEVAKLYGVNDYTIRRWCAKGLLDAHKQGRFWYITLSESTIKQLKKES